MKRNGVFSFLVVLLMVASLANASGTWKIKNGSASVLRDGKTVLLEQGAELLSGDVISAVADCVMASDDQMLTAFSGALLSFTSDGILSIGKGDVLVQGRDLTVDFGMKKCHCEGASFFSTSTEGDEVRLSVVPILGQVLVTETLTAEDGSRGTRFKTIEKDNFVTLTSKPGIPAPKPTIENEILSGKVEKLPQQTTNQQPSIQKPKLAKLSSGSGDSDVNRDGFDGTFKDGDVLEVPAGSVQTISIPGGKAVITGPAKLKFTMKEVNGVMLPAIELESGKVEIFVESGDGIVVISGDLTITVRSGKFTCNRANNTIDISQQGGSSDVAVKSKIKKSGIRASGSGMQVTYPDGTTETLANGQNPSRDNPSGFTMTGACGFSFDETSSDSYRPPPPPPRHGTPAGPKGPDRGDVSPH